MSRADNARFFIRKKNRNAIGRQHNQHKASRAGHHGVGLWRLRRFPSLRHRHDVRRMHLLAAQRLFGLGLKIQRRQTPVFQNGVFLVAVPQPAVQRGKVPLAHAAIARKKAMAHAERIFQIFRFQHFHHEKPAVSFMAGDRMPSTLNCIPICAGSTRRCMSSSIFCACSSVAWRFRTAARKPMPMASRNAP